MCCCCEPRKTKSGYNVTIVGRKFGSTSPPTPEDLKVTFDGQPSPNVAWINPTVVIATAPEGRSSLSYGPAEVLVVVARTQSQTDSGVNATFFFTDQCEPGWSPSSNNKTCQRCLNRTYSPEGFACNSCPKGALCTSINGLFGTIVPVTLPGWWRQPRARIADESSLDFDKYKFYSCK